MERLQLGPETPAAAVPRGRGASPSRPPQPVLVEPSPVVADLRDALTGLPSRARLRQEVEVAGASAAASRTPVAVVQVDLLDVGRITARLGQELADELRRRVARRLRAQVRAGELLARAGPDSFALLISDLSPTGAAMTAGQVRAAVEALSERLLAAVTDPVVAGEAELLVEAAVGAAILPFDAADGPTLLRHAEAAAYAAREASPPVAAWTDATPDPLARLESAARLRAALPAGELELHYQPIVGLPGGGINAVEALVRWRHPDRGLVPPDEFIPLAESTGVIEPLGDWVLEELCRQAVAWERLGLRPGLGMNVSPWQLRRPGFGVRLRRTLQRHGVDPGRLVVELTESAWSGERTILTGALDELRGEGITLALDDFGAGQSSLWRLRELPMQVIKLDRALLRGVPRDPRAAGILRGVLTLAEACGCDVVAEGVETDEQYRLLAGTACHYAQGYLMARPAPAEETTRRLTDGLVADRRG